MNSRRAKVSFLFPAIAAAAVAGTLGLSTSAHADSPYCGQSADLVAGEYSGPNLQGGPSRQSLALTSDPGKVDGSGFHGRLNGSTVQYDFVRGSVMIYDKLGGTTSLTPVCGGGDLHPSVLIGNGEGDTPSFHYFVRDRP